MNTDTLDHHHTATECANCGAAVSGNFCHECGQEIVLHVPSTREFMHEFIGHYVALEGRLWKSLGLLLFRPGRLTIEYIKGRRVRYIQPLRLYLTLSVIFFAVMKYGSHALDFDVGSGKTPAAAAHSATPANRHARPARHDDDDDDDDKVVRALTGGAPASPSASSSTAAPAAAGKDGAAASSAPRHPPTAELVHEDRPGEMREGTRKLRQFVGGFNAHWADKLGQFVDLSLEERNALVRDAFYHDVPYAVFFMMPLFALYLKVLYLGSGRRYGEHLLFALHTNGFAYLAMSFMVLLPDSYGLGVLKWLLFAWLVIYLPAAMRRVYGGSRTVTGLRWVVLILLHLVTMTLAIFAAIAFGILQ